MAVIPPHAPSYHPDMESYTMVCCLKKSRAVVACALLGPLLTSGCTTYRITRWDKNSNSYRAVPGVPFYLTDAACRQETTYGEEIIKLKLRAEELEYVKATGAVSSRREVYIRERNVSRTDATEAALMLLGSKLRDRDDLQAVREAFESTSFTSYNARDPWHSHPTALLSNQNTLHRFIDYSNTYYYNAERPPIGNTTAAAELNADGTLAKASATIEDRTLETFLGMIPISDVLTDRLIGAAAGGAVQESNPRPKYEYYLTAEVIPVLHTLTKYDLEAPMPCVQVAAIQRDDTKASYTRTVGAPKPAAEQPQGNVVGISGQLVLPKKP